MIYISIVYKVYRLNTFIARLDAAGEARVFFANYDSFTNYVDDHIFLLIIDFTYLIKALVQLRLLPIMGPIYAVFKMLTKELLTFIIFFVL